MDFDSVCFSDRTVLSASFSPSSGKPATSTNEVSSTGPSAADIWTYLISLTESRNVPVTQEPRSLASIEKPTGKLKHIRAEDFDGSSPLERVGEGACYRVDKRKLQPMHGSFVIAIKRLKVFANQRHGSSSGSSISQSVSTILRELHILTHPPLQNHPCIASLIGYTSDVATPEDSNNTPPYVEISLVAEFATYGTLSEFLARRSKGEDKLGFLAKVRLMHDVASGLEALHASGIVQGDVKLQNVLVFEDAQRTGGYRAKLSDFGHAIVGLGSSGDAAGEEERYRGTPLLNAPEVREVNRDSHPPFLAGEGVFKCDVFSYGLLAWEIILDGARFITTVTSNVIKDEYNSDSFAWLHSLAKDDLLRRALESLSSRTADEQDIALVGIVRRVLEATLRDIPGERKTIETVLEILREQRILRSDARDLAANHSSKRMMLDFSTLASWSPGKVDESSLQLPLSIQQDLLAQLRQSTAAAGKPSTRRNALYHLAMSQFAGFGGSRIDTASALALLSEAAVLGSPKALAICFRLHTALGYEIPPDLLDLQHPIIVMEKELQQASPETYFVNRIRTLEKIQQTEILNQPFDIFHRSDMIATRVFLHDIQDILPDIKELELTELRCVPVDAAEDDPPVEERLLYLAAHIGLMELVQAILLKAGSEAVARFRSSNGEPATVGAAQGGNFAILELLLANGVSPFGRKTSVLHWLMMFPPHEAEQVLEMLFKDRDRTYLFNLVAPAMDIYFLPLFGTALEFAIAVNDISLVQLLLSAATRQLSSKRKQLPGWTDNTFRIATSCHLSSLLPLLHPHEESHRCLFPYYHESSRLLLSRGKRHLLPYGLFDVSRPPSILLLLLLHGTSSRAAVDATVDGILKLDICSINDEDVNGSVLAQAIRSSPCDVSLDILSSLVSRGAIFSADETLLSIIYTYLAKRNDTAEGPILRLLLESKVLPANIEVLAAAVQSAHADLVEVVLSFGGKDLDVNTPLVEKGVSIPLLHVAVMAPHNAKIVQLLLEHGANIDARMDAQLQDSTALEIAITIPVVDVDAIDVLVSRGSSLLSSKNVTIIHAAAALDSLANGAHVLFHLLSYPRVKELIDARSENGFRPLHVACFTANEQAVLALLEGEAEAAASGDMDMIALATEIGRRPNSSPRWKVWKEKDYENTPYRWRHELEKIIIALLDKHDPGHGRTPLHIAASLGNFRRVTELVESGAGKVWSNDRNNITPVGLLEDIEALEREGEDEVYITNVKQVKEFLTLKMFEEAGKTFQDPQAFDAALLDIPAVEIGSQERANALLDGLQQLKEKEENQPKFQASSEEPSVLAVRYSQLIELRKQELGANHLDTLTAMSKLSEVYCFQRRFQEAEELQLQLLHGREAQLTYRDPDLYQSWSDRINILCKLEKFEDAVLCARVAVSHTLDEFSSDHLVYLTAGLDIYYVNALAGKPEELDGVIETLQIIQGRLLDLSFGSRLVYVRLEAALTCCYCRAGRFEDVRLFIRNAPRVLEYAKEEEFLPIFYCVIDSIATTLDMHEQWEYSENIRTTLVEVCLKVRGPKAYCTQAAMQDCVEHYRSRCMWKEAAALLLRLLEVLRARYGNEDINVLRGMRLLADVYEQQKYWIEANVLLHQAVEVSLRILGNDHEDNLYARASLCQNFIFQRQYEKAERLGREVAHDFRRIFGEDDQTLTVEGKLAHTLLALGKSSEALEIQQNMLSANIRLHSDSHEKTKYAIETLSRTLTDMGRYHEAEELYERHMKISREVSGADSLAAAHSLFIKAKCKERAGQKQEAIDLLLLSLSIEQGVPKGQNTVHTLGSLQLLSYQYLHLERYSEAVEVLQQILAEGPRVYGTELRSEIIQAAEDLGVATEALGQLEAAEKHYNFALDLARKLYGDKNDDTICFIQALLGVEFELGRLEKAHDHAQEILAHKREKLGDYHEDTLTAIEDMATLCSSLSLWGKAEQLQREILRYRTWEATGSISDLPDAHNDKIDFVLNEQTVSIMQGLIESCRHHSRYKDAQAFSQKVLKYHTKTLGREHDETIYAFLSMVWVLSDMEKYEEAQVLLAAEIEVIRQLRGFEGMETYCENLRNAVAHLAYIYYNQERWDEAASVQLQLVEVDREVNPEKVEKAIFLSRIYVKQGLYEAAEGVGLEVLTKRREARSGKEGEEGDLSGDAEAMEQIAVLVGLYSAAGRWSEARKMGEEVLDARRKNRKFSGDVDLLDALEALKPVYDALGAEDELFDVGVLAVDERKLIRREKQRSEMLMSMSEHAFQKAQREGALRQKG